MKKKPAHKFYFRPIEDDLPSLPDGVHPICQICEDENTWLILEGRHYGEEYKFTKKIPPGTVGFWVKDGQIAWLSKYDLDWALGLLPGSEPWRRKVETSDLLEFINRPRDTVATKPVINGLVHEKDFFIVAGLQKTRKTTTLLDLAVALSTGGEWLKWKAAERFRVLLIDAEMNRDEIEKILADACQRRGANLATVNEMVKVISLKDYGLPLSVYDLYRLALDMATHRADVLIADNWRGFLPQGFIEGVQKHAIRVFYTWKAIQSVIGPKVPLILAAHAKDGKPDADPLDAIGGHHALAGMVNGGFTIFTTDGETGRIGHHCRRHPRGSFPVRLAGGGRFWEPVGLDGGRRKTQYRDETILVNNVAANKEIAADPLADAITMALKDNPGPQSLNFIKRSVQGRSQTVGDLVKSMVAHELLLQDEHGRLSLTPPT